MHAQKQATYRAHRSTCIRAYTHADSMHKFMSTGMHACMVSIYTFINLYISLPATFRNLSQHFAPRFSLPRFCSHSRSLAPSSQWIEVEDIAALHRGYLREDFARIRASGVEPTLVVQLRIFTCTHSCFCRSICFTIYLHIYIFINLSTYIHTRKYIFQSFLSRNSDTRWRFLNRRDNLGEISLCEGHFRRRHLYL